MWDARYFSAGFLAAVSFVIFALLGRRRARRRAIMRVAPFSFGLRTAAAPGTVAERQAAAPRAADAAAAERAELRLLQQELDRLEHLQAGSEQTAMTHAVEASIVAAVEALPKLAWASAAKARGGAQDEDAYAQEEDCALCIEHFGGDDEVRVLRCGHYFHKQCIDHWLLDAQQHKERTCPLCAGCAI